MGDRIKYHPGFVGGLGVLLWDYREMIDIIPEKWLSTEGIRMDVLIIKKDPVVTLKNDMCRIFRGHNILEYKSPEDELSIDAFAKVMAYAYLYKSLGDQVDAIPLTELTVTIYRHNYPRELFRKLIEAGMQVVRKTSGIYYVRGASVFPVQLIVGRELEPREYAMFRVLTPEASRQDLTDFNEIAFLRRDALYKRYVDSIFQVSVSANRQLYDQMTREDKKMCEALKDLLKEDFAEAEARAEARGAARGKAIGEAQGEIKGMIKLYHEEMGLAPQEIIIKIMERFSLDEETARTFVESTLGLQPA
jgi:hypothetical protein